VNLKVSFAGHIVKTNITDGSCLGLKFPSSRITTRPSPHSCVFSSSLGLFMRWGMMILISDLATDKQR
jgi:hypothetical protein